MTKDFPGSENDRTRNLVRRTVLKKIRDDDQCRHRALKLRRADRTAREAKGYDIVVDNGYHHVRTVSGGLGLQLSFCPHPHAGVCACPVTLYNMLHSFDGMGMLEGGVWNWQGTMDSVTMNVLSPIVDLTSVSPLNKNVNDDDKDEVNPLHDELKRLLIESFTDDSNMVHMNEP